MNNLQVFKNDLFEVSAIKDNEHILFDAEQVAKSLGIVSKTEKGGSFYENVRWSRVNDFLPQVAEIKKGDLIPEPLVYKLAFKASNEVAEKFQDWLAIEVIPSIRMSGSYTAPALSPKEQRIELLKLSLEHEEKFTEHDDRITNLELNMRIDGSQEYRINMSGKAKVLEALGGKRSAAYEKLSRKAFAALWTEFKRHFEIPRYSELPKARFEEGLEFISMWQPETSLRIEIQNANGQTRLEVI